MLQEAIMVDGLDFCLNALQEECAELIVAISHLRRERCGRSQVMMEMADVQIMFDLVLTGFGHGRVMLDRMIYEKATIIGEKVRFRRDNGQNGLSKHVTAVACPTMGDRRHVETTKRIGSLLPSDGGMSSVDEEAEGHGITEHFSLYPDS
jgi:hypothetical protein